MYSTIRIVCECFQSIIILKLHFLTYRVYIKLELCLFWIFCGLPAKGMEELESPSLYCALVEGMSDLMFSTPTKDDSTNLLLCWEGTENLSE